MHVIVRILGRNAPIEYLDKKNKVWTTDSVKATLFDEPGVWWCVHDPYGDDHLAKAMLRDNNPDHVYTCYHIDVQDWIDGKRIFYRGDGSLVVQTIDDDAYL